MSTGNRLALVALAIVAVALERPVATSGRARASAWSPHASAGRVGARQAQAPRVEPYRRPSPAPLDFRGPDRDEPEPEVSEVVLGWFGPGDPDHPTFGTMWRGAVLALDDENADGGYHSPGGNAAAAPGVGGKPFRLVPAWSESPWQAGIADLLRLVYNRRAWAVIGGVDGTSTHLAVQVALKARFVLLSPGSTDVSADRANVPWLFSLPPSDDAVAPLLVGAMGCEAGGHGCAIVASSDHTSHATLAAVRREMDRRQVAPSAVVEIDPAEPDLVEVATHVAEGHPSGVLVLAPGPRAGAMVGALRRGGFGGTIVVGPAAGDAFLRAAGIAAEGALAPMSIEPGPGWDRFASAYARRWQGTPDDAAVNGYDALRLVAAAVRQAGLNRARIRDAVRALAPWRGVGGTVQWDAVGRNVRRVRLGRWVGGRLVPVH